MGYEVDPQFWAISQQISDALANKGRQLDPQAVYAWSYGPESEEDEDLAGTAERVICGAIGGAQMMEALEDVARVLDGVCYFLNVPGYGGVVGGIDLEKLRDEVLSRV